MMSEKEFSRRLTAYCMKMDELAEQLKKSPEDLTREKMQAQADEWHEKTGGLIPMATVAVMMVALFIGLCYATIKGVMR